MSKTKEARESMAWVGGIFTVAGVAFVVFVASVWWSHAWMDLTALGLLALFLLGIGVPCLLMALDSNHWRQEREKELRDRMEAGRKYEEDIPTIGEFIGSDPDFTGAKSTKEYIKAMRS